MNSNTSHVDILIYVALGEEFSTVLETIGAGFQARELKEIALTIYEGQVNSPVLNRTFRVAISPAGKMGNTHASGVTSALLEKLNPRNVIVLGIAGSSTDTLQPGDVFIPDHVNEYLANSAPHSDDGTTWTFRTSGNHFQTSPRLLNRFQQFRHTCRDYFDQWSHDTEEYARALITPEARSSLMSAGVTMRPRAGLLAGDDNVLASGPSVGKDKAFLNWLKNHLDRKIAAVEMESAGVYDAVLVRTPAPKVLAIRGISDFADERKEKLEAAAKDGFRRLAMKNACALMLRGLQAGLFNEEGPAPSVSLAISSKPERWISSVFVIGGVTGETSSPATELPRLHRACLKLGHALGSAGIQLVVCSPFPDSADFYTAMGYSEGDANVVLHLHSPSHPKVKAKREELSALIERKGLEIRDWFYPGPEDDSDESWTQAWLLAQLQALGRADAVIAVGGKTTKTANTLLHLAEARGLPIIPFTFLGGAAERVFKRRDWPRLNANIDLEILRSERGITKAVEIANQMIKDALARAYTSNSKPKTFFISRAKENKQQSDVLVEFLRQRGYTVLLGDEEVRQDQMVEATITQMVLRSDISILLWSRDYALSPWCYDELILSTSQRAIRGMGVWLFNLDDSPIVPTEARKLTAISARGTSALVTAVEELLSHYG